MDDLIERLEADPTVGALVAEAIALAGGDAARAAGLVRLLLAGTRPDFVGGFASVVGAALLVIGAERHRPPTTTMGERVVGLCGRSQAALGRSRWIRAQTAELVAGVRARRSAASALD
jgi:hypothetical protein